MFLSFAGLAGGQIVQPGYPSFSPQDCHGYECVDLLNNTVSLNVPVRSKAGALPFRSSLSGSYFMMVGSGPTFNPSLVYGSPNATGLSLNWNGMGAINGASYSAYPSQHTTTSCSAYPYGPTTEYIDWVVQTADGTIHPLPGGFGVNFTDVNGSGVSCVTGAGFTNVKTADGSGFTVSAANNATQSVAYTRGGVQMDDWANKQTDTNGNSIAFSRSTLTLVDSMGLPVLAYPTSVRGPYEWLDQSGNYQQVSMTSGSKTLATKFGCSSIADFSPSIFANIPSSVNFADGTSLGITYEATPTLTAT